MLRSTLVNANILTLCFLYIFFHIQNMFYNKLHKSKTKLNKKSIIKHNFVQFCLLQCLKLE